jgi:hypothetical protein
MPCLRGGRARALRASRLIVVCALSGCTGGKSSTGATASVVSAPSPTGGSTTPTGAGGPNATSTISADATPFSSIAEVLRTNPADPAARRRLGATALLGGIPASVRYAALHQLELAPGQGGDTLQVAVAFATLTGSDGDSRFLAENGVAVLTRLNTPEARAALAQIHSPSSQTDAATALAAQRKGG